MSGSAIVQAGNALALSRSRSRSYATQRLYWFGFVALHSCCLSYFAIVSWCYWNLPDSLLDRWLVIYNLGMGTNDHRTVAVFHGCIAVLHFAYLSWIIGWSLKQQRLVFVVYGLSSSTASSRKATGTRRSLKGLYQSTRSKLRLIDVDGPYFDLVLLSREMFETGLQSYQASRMSALIPRTLLNQAFVALLILNCWSTALLHCFPVSTTTRRLVAMACDCILDLVTSVGITTVLLLIYSADFDFQLTQFPARKWYEDDWVVYAMSEFQMILVTSRNDLGMRMVFALSMLSNIANMKKLLTLKTLQTRRNAGGSNCQTTAVLPFHPSLNDIRNGSKRSRMYTALRSVPNFTRILFFLWGVAIMSLHLYAESIPAHPQCKMQVKPWFVSQPSCSLLVLDCYKSSYTGAENEITAAWSSFDPATTVRVVIRHCANLVIPLRLTAFTRLKALKIYNSTITSWSEIAGISQIHHPELLMLFLVRTNMTAGELPAGLRGNHLPRLLLDIEFCVTNLRVLPDDLDLKWPQFASIYFEACNLSEVPPSLARLAPYDLSVALNPISNIPSALLQGNVRFLHVGGTRISELPRIATNVSPFLKLRLENTNVSYFWDWIDPVVASVGVEISDVPTILASNTPYCSDLQQLYDRERSTFSFQWHDGQSQLLSDPAMANWATLKKAVSCDKWTSTWYPLENEDANSGIK